MPGLAAKPIVDMLVEVTVSFANILSGLVELMLTAIE
jgi:GrpB-like predicted nucleotidyltransferase (UPF0157 family)